MIDKFQTPIGYLSISPTHRLSVAKVITLFNILEGKICEWRAENMHNDDEYGMPLIVEGDCHPFNVVLSNRLFEL